MARSSSNIAKPYRSLLSKLFIVAYFSIVSSHSYAQSSCDSVFPDAVSSSANGSVLQMRFNSKIFDSPDNILDTTTSDFHSSSRCGSALCGISNSVVNQMSFSGSYPTGNPNLDVGFEDVETVSPGNYDRAQFGTSSVVTMQTGVYVIRRDFKMQGSSQIIVQGSGTVVVYVQGDFSASSNAIINSAGGASNIFFYVEGDIDFGSTVDYTGVTYSKGAFEIGSDAIYKGAATAEGFISLGSRAEVTFDDSVVSATNFDSQCTSAGSSLAIDSIDISPSTFNASVCSPIEITLTVLDQNGDLLTGFTGEINLSTTLGNGDWSKTSVASDALGTLNVGASESGSASYTFDASGADGGQVTLEFSNARFQTVNVSAEDSATGTSDTSNGIFFSENEFSFSDAMGASKDVIAGREHTFTVQMRKADGVGGASCGVATGYQVDNVEVTFARFSNDPGGAAPILVDSAGNQLTVPEASPGSPNFQAGFVNGEATVKLITTDVARFRIIFSDDSGAFASEEIFGHSGSLDVRPFGFDISVAGNPQSSDHTGSTFIKSAEPFAVSVRAVAWQSSDDIDADGQPDGHATASPADNADLSDNPSLPNFGQEPFQEGITLSAVEISPNSGVVNVLESSTSSIDGRRVTSFTNGAGITNTVLYEDVGVIALQATLTNKPYLTASVAETEKMDSGSNYVGRFYPAAFRLDSGQVQDQCTTGLDFTYMGDEVNPSFVISAVNILGDVTPNYEGDYGMLVGDATDVAIGIYDANTDTNLTSRFVYSAASTMGWSAGQLALTMSLNDQRAGAPDGPFTTAKIGITPTDADGVTFLSVDLDLDVDNDSVNDFIELGESEQRFGRLRLASAFGPETANLPVEFVTEYWNGSFWEVNVDDSCTTVGLDTITYPGGTIDVVANRNITVGTGTTTGTYPDATSSDIVFVAGVARHFFSAPGAGNTGSFSVEVDISSRWWLGFDWNQDGDYLQGQLPTANYQFGSYRGHDRVINWQEIYP